MPGSSCPSGSSPLATPGVHWILALLPVLVSALFQSSCGRRTSEAHLPWVIHWKGSSVICGRSAGDPSFLLEDLRFFIHDVRLVDAAGKETRVPFVPDSRWQTDSVSLLDFAPDCSQPRATHSRVDLRMPAGQWTALRFRLGVPADLRQGGRTDAGVSDPDGPFSWSGRGGFRFLKLEARRGAVPVHVALGEEGCEEFSAGDRECNGPRLTDITVPWAPGPVVVELSDLFETSTGPQATSCAGMEDPACAHAFAGLQLQFHKGTSARSHP